MSTAFERGHDARRLRSIADVDLVGAPQRGELPVGEAVALGLAKQFGADGRQAAGAAQLIFHVDQLLQIVKKPAVDLGELVNFVDAHAVFEGVAQIPDALGAGAWPAWRGFLRGWAACGVPQQVLGVAAEAEAADFQAAQRLLKRFLERAADGHRLADALHLRGERGVGLGEFLEGEARDLGHDVIDRGLEAGHRLAGDVVGQLVQPIADGQLGGDLGDGKARGLRGQALERLTRGFISMTIIRPVSGSMANWMFDPPVSTPISRMTASEASRIR